MSSLSKQLSPRAGGGGRGVEVGEKKRWLVKKPRGSDRHH